MHKWAMYKTNWLDEPIDNTHAESIRAREIIRDHVAVLKQEVSVWEPRPYPGETQ